MRYIKALILLIAVAGANGGTWNTEPGQCVNKEGEEYSYLQWFRVRRVECNGRVHRFAKENPEGLVLGWEHLSQGGECRVLLQKNLTAGMKKSPGDNVVLSGTAVTPPSGGTQVAAEGVCYFGKQCLYPPPTYPCRFSAFHQPPPCECDSPPPAQSFCASDTQIPGRGRQCVVPTNGGCLSGFHPCRPPPPCKCDRPPPPGSYCASSTSFRPFGRSCRPRPPSAPCGADEVACGPNGFPVTPTHPLTPQPTPEPTPAPTDQPTPVPMSVTPTPTAPPVLPTPTPTTAPTPSPTSPPVFTPAPTNASTAAPTSTPTAAPIPPPPVCKCNANVTGTSRWYCASMTQYSASGRVCSQVRSPGGQCGSNELKCSSGTRPAKFKPSGQTCGCKSYVAPCTGRDLLLCVTKEGVCSRPNINGTCAAEGAASSGSLCAGRKLYRLAFKLMRNATVKFVHEKIAEAAKARGGQVLVVSVCPAAACPRGKCPYSAMEMKAKGCTASGTVGWERPYYVDIDVQVSDEDEHAQITEHLFQSVQNAQTDGGGSLGELGVTSVATVYPSQEAETSEDTGSETSWWTRYWWVVALCCSVLVVGAVAKTVRFHENVDFDSSRKTDTRKHLPRGMEGCYRTHRKTHRRSLRDLLTSRGRSASQYPPFDDMEMCIDAQSEVQLPVTEYLKYTPLELEPAAKKGKGSNGSVRSRSTESSGSSEPEMLI